MPDNNDLFTPPSKEELDIFSAPPTKEELAGLQSSDSISQMGGDSGQAALNSLGVDDKGAGQAGLSGLAQGATFGFSDELGAAVDVAKDALSQNPTAKKWREYQKLREAANKADQEAHPGGYLGGELVGGLATAPLMPELGGAKAVGSLGEMSPSIAKFLASKGTNALSKIAGAGTKMAIEGAPAGALYGVGSSEADINNPEVLGKDIASSAAMGSLGGLAIGAGVQGGKEAFKGVGKLAKDYDFTRKLGSAFKMGKEGIGFDSSADKEQVAKLSKSIPEDITNQIMTVDKQLGQKVGDSLKNAEDAGVTINIDPDLKQSAEETFKLFTDNPVLLSTMDPKSKALFMKASQDGLGDLSPIEARALKDTFYDLKDKLGGLSSDVANIARQRGTSLGQALDQQLKEQIPEYKDAATKFATFRASIPETLLQPNLPADLRTKQLGDLKNKSTELYKGVSNVFGTAHMPGSSAIEGPRAAMGELGENLKSLQQSNPEAMQALGGGSDDVMKKWRDQADRMAVLRQSQGVEPHEGLKKTFLGSVVGSGEGFTYNMANRAGKMVQGISESGPVKASTRVFNAGNDNLMNLATILKNKQGAEPLGTALENALNNKDDMAKNAVLFKLLQIPEYRDMLRDKSNDQQ